MRSGPEHIQSAKPSAHDLRQAPATIATQPSLHPAHSIGDHNFLPSSHRRAQSAPPRISANSSTKGRSGVGQELGDQKDTLTIKDRISLQESFLYTHFYHPDFEVVARNLPAPIAQELKHILETFAASFESRKASCSDSDPSKHDGYNMMLNEGPKHASAVLDDPRTTTKTSLIGDSCAPPRSSLPQAEYRSFMDTADSRACACSIGEAVHQVLPQFAASTDPLVSTASPHHNPICYRQSSQTDTNEDHSGSSVDFLYFARTKDPESVRELEEEYDDMMKQME